MDTQILAIKEAIHSNGEYMKTRTLYCKKLKGITTAKAAIAIFKNMEKMGYGRLERIINKSGGPPTYMFHLWTCTCERCSQQSSQNTVNQHLN